MLYTSALRAVRRSLLVRATGAPNCTPPAPFAASCQQCNDLMITALVRLKSDVKGFEDLDKPVKFTTSKASGWKADKSFGSSRPDDVPEAETWSVMLSLFVFMLYFFVLREENDMDEEMKRPLWERIPGLERQQLDVIYSYNLEHGIDNTDVVARMKELDAKTAAEAAAAAASNTNKS